MEQIGTSVVDLSTNTEIQFFGDTPGQHTIIENNVLILPNNIQVFCPSVGEEYQGYRYVNRMFVDGESNSIVYDGEQVIVTGKRPMPYKPTLSDLQIQLASIQEQMVVLSNSFSTPAHSYKE